MHLHSLHVDMNYGWRAARTSTRHHHHGHHGKLTEMVRQFPNYFIAFFFIMFWDVLPALPDPAESQYFHRATTNVISTIQLVLGILFVVSIEAAKNKEVKDPD